MRTAARIDPDSDERSAADDGAAAPAVPKPFARPTPVTGPVGGDRPRPVPFVVPAVPEAAAPVKAGGGRGHPIPPPAVASVAEATAAATHDAEAAADVLESIAARLRAGSLRLGAGRIDRACPPAVLASVLVALHADRPPSSGPAA